MLRRGRGIDLRRRAGRRLRMCPHGTTVPHRQVGKAPSRLKRLPREAYILARTPQLVNGIGAFLRRFTKS